MEKRQSFRVRFMVMLVKRDRQVDRSRSIQFPGKTKINEIDCVFASAVSLEERLTADLHIYQDNPLSDANSDSPSL